jgi:hypothetical protein
MKFSHAISGSALLFLYACGGGGGTPSDVGVFVDAPVEGLTYQSGAFTGTTDSAGKFTYGVGQTVTFSVNGVTLPVAACQGELLLLLLLMRELPQQPRIMVLVLRYNYRLSHGVPAPI